MKKIRIAFDEASHTTLNAIAQRESCSMSTFVVRLIRQELGLPVAEDPAHDDGAHLEDHPDDHDQSHVR